MAWRGVAWRVLVCAWVAWRVLVCACVRACVRVPVSSLATTSGSHRWRVAFYSQNACSKQ